MAEKRIKRTLAFSPEVMDMVDRHYLEDGCRFRCDFIEKAIRFYCGYLTAEDYREYFPNVIVSTMKGTLDSMENRMAALLFKNTVELSMVLHVMAATHGIQEETLDDLRRMCVTDVKKTNGTISLKEALKFQKS